MISEPMITSQSRRRWLQFSLWTLMVLVLMLGSTSVVVLILIWPSVRVLLVPMATPVPVEMVELTKDESGPGDLAVASGSDAETGTDDIDEPAESQASSNPDFGLRSMEDQMAVLDDIATIAAIMAMDQGDSYDLGQGQAHAGFTRSSVAATGDDIVPPWQRWEVRFVTSGLQLYARQLDSLKVELGAVGGGPWRGRLCVQSDQRTA
jgi:hypothetical protein